MIDGKFLRRIEDKPSNDLATRTDLYQYQLEYDLQPITWEKLVQPIGNDEQLKFANSHVNYIANYRKNIRSYDPDVILNVILPGSCTNPTIYNLCLLNRVRYEMNYPPIAFAEDDWIEFWIYMHDPIYRKNLAKFLMDHMYNG